MYKPAVIILLAISTVLAACTSTPAVETVTPIQASPTEKSEVTQASVQETEIPVAGGMLLYKIVPGESSLSYEVGEVFINQSNRFNVAVGITTQISGEISVDLSNPGNSNMGTINADISQFKSDSSRRDNAIRDRFIESARFPTVTFQTTSIEGLPDNYKEGEEVSLKLTGNLTVREVTRPVTFDAIAKIKDGTLIAEASTTILMSDFGFGPIDIAGILKTEDEVKASLVIIARP